MYRVACLNFCAEVVKVCFVNCDFGAEAVQIRFIDLESEAPGAGEVSPVSSCLLSFIPCQSKGLLRLL